ncbi:hypothetical protein SERLADRAFT_479248 [Serpula lacrymans var. lacrymans S7.9]|uniref:Uncharacterized protein n=1 Tax=Serpula lacrymans var. lacrymans (strain S7.9) TaxID=578457 RepID=F8PBI3_SERL9|nr:uncharacterized protein SERLADRAFT_479248 [Serpula lacrymans var. lacrymans S7.9]EGO19621.1 hypothetical protein SERLADRAFT_479248 [Serpula lacrymans var. lacrymans S7.9]
MADVENSFTEISKTDIEITKVPATACLTLIWQYGDRHYHAGRWSVAADWFLCGTHSIFKSLGSVSSSKCLRKTALCYLQCKEYARAATIIRRCHSNEATTHYVKLLISVHQGLKMKLSNVFMKWWQLPVLTGRCFC